MIIKPVQQKVLKIGVTEPTVAAIGRNEAKNYGFERIIDSCGGSKID